MKLDHVKRCNALEVNLEKLKRNQSTLAKDVEDSRSARLEAIKRAEVVEDRALRSETLLSQMDAELGRRVEEFKDSKEGDLFVGKESAATVAGFVAKFLGDFPQLADMLDQFKSEWPHEYCVGSSVGSPDNVEAVVKQVVTPSEGIKATIESGEVAKGEVADEEAIV
ncbi:hypothetical protein LIER_14459 [Lithospermum erythrorhizon]|uniref:Uncharacterized protein n=1 Tax=Lithospermum erythrorhizon TaxID=34254 RepID=A0AAV3Q1R5_LITER